MDTVSQPFEMRTRTRVPGPSMWHLIVAAMASVGVAAVVTVVAILVIVVTHDSRRVVILLFIMVAVLGAGFLLMFWASKQMKKEFAAGYTTCRMGCPNLEQVDESTSLIVGVAGEPLLSRQVRRDRVHTFKATRVGDR